MSNEAHADAIAILERSCAAQGIATPTSDPAVVERVAQILQPVLGASESTRAESRGRTTKPVA